MKLGDEKSDEAMQLIAERWSSGRCVINHPRNGRVVLERREDFSRRCRYRDCKEGYPVTAEVEQVTCSTCRASLGLDPIPSARFRWVVIECERPDKEPTP